jgi:ATP-binding cassette subfamily B protein
VDALRRFYGEESVGFGRVVMLFLVNFIALLTLNVQLALVSVVVVPLVTLISIFFFKRISQRYEAFQEQEGKLSTTLQENLTGIRVVRAFARQPYERDKFERDNKERFARGKRLLLLHAIYWPSTDILVGIQLVVGYFIGAMMAINGIITVGTFLAYMGMLGWIMWPMRNVGRLIVQMSIGLVSYGRVADIIKEDREPLDVGVYRPAKPLRGEIIFDNVSFAYDEDLPVLNNVTFRADPGQVVALVGATGSGKSSLVNLLPRFYEYSGSIKLDGVELRDYPRRYLRRQIGLVQQEPFLFSRTILENITYGVIEAWEGEQGSRGAEEPRSNGAIGGRFGWNGRGTDDRGTNDRGANGTAEAAYLHVPDEEVFRAAKAAAVHDVILTFPEGYGTIVGEKGVTLSGGQKQRVTLARTLLKDPRILILDDATSSVDTETEAAIQDALDELLPGRTTFIIAHRIQTVMRADLILVLEKGRVVQCGTHEELIDEPGTYQRIFHLQSQIEEDLEEDLQSVMSNGQ